MAKLCPLNTFVDAAGEPLAGGKIYTYITGTSTPKTTYTNSGGGTAHPNPVILGSNGRKEIWLDTDQAYRFVIKDSNDVQIGSTIDDVLPTTSFAAIAGAQNIDITGYALLTTGSNNLYITPDTGAVVIDGMSFPTTPGSSGQVLSTDGISAMAWSNAGVASLDAIPDVNITSVASGNLLKYNGSEWVNSAQSTLSITASQVSDLATATVTFSNKFGNISQWTNDSGYVTASSSATFTNKGGNISQWTNDSNYLTGTASQAEMEAASSNTVYVTPGRIHHHPGVAKVWALFTMNGTGPVLEVTSSYNVASTTSLGGSTFRVDFTTAFSSADYCEVLRYYGEESTATAVNIVSRAAGSITLGFSATVTGKKYNLVIFGDQ